MSIAKFTAISLLPTSITTEGKFLYQTGGATAYVQSVSKPVRPLLIPRPRQRILTIDECNKEIENFKKQLFELRVVNNKLFIDNHHLSSVLYKNKTMLTQEDYESSQLSNLYGGYIFTY